MNKTILPYRMYVSDYIGAIDSDIISVDIYPLQVEKDSGRMYTLNYWLWNLDILADACRATGRDLWVITQATGNTIREGGTQRHCDTVEDQRWQNWVSMSFGAKAITVYRNGEKTEIAGETLNLTLENREGIFVTVSF